MESDVSRISFPKLLLRSLLAGLIATLVLFPFHYLMRKVALLPSLPYFEGPIGKVFYLALIFLLAYADLFFVTLIRGRNESSEILGKFVRRGIPLRYLADLLVVFLCCLLSFSICSKRRIAAIVSPSLSTGESRGSGSWPRSRCALQ